MAMFEVNLFTPAQFGAFVSWLVINRGPLSALVHPNTDEELRDHTQRATWLGERVPVDTSLFYDIARRKVLEESVRGLKE
jgi:aromatic ring-cleaving dioxygenase